MVTQRVLPLANFQPLTSVVFWGRACKQILFPVIVHKTPFESAGFAMSMHNAQPNKQENGLLLFHQDI